MNEDKKVSQEADTKVLEVILCASGQIDPLLNKPLWPSHRYPKPDETYTDLYCPTHRRIYDRIEQQRKLNSLDGQE